MTSILNMDEIKVLHPDGTIDLKRFDKRASAEEYVLECIKRCKATSGTRTITRSWAPDIVIEGGFQTKKKR